MNFLAGMFRTGLAGCLLACGAAQAARPMVADDATILGAGQCQFEAWREHHPGDTEYWAAPHCNFGNGWELVAGLGSLEPAADRRATGGVLIAKTVFRALKPDDWAAGLSLSDQIVHGGALANVALNLPVTVSLLDDRVRIDINAGWMHQRGFRTGATWALGAEWTATNRVDLTLETYGIGHIYTQAGLRYVTTGGQVVLDAAIGDRISLSGKERYFALGLTINRLTLR
ncbi:MAG: hypothetical protein ACXWC4_07065 [Telluria sp.]